MSFFLLQSLVVERPLFQETVPLIGSNDMQNMQVFLYFVVQTSIQVWSEKSPTNFDIRINI